MDAIGPSFRLRPQDSTWPCQVNDWLKMDGYWAVHHQPTHCVFEIFLPDHLSGSDLVGPLHFSARLVHVCDGHPVPAQRRQGELAREAILFFCICSGLLHNVPERQDTEIPF